MSSNKSCVDLLWSRVGQSPDLPFLYYKQQQDYLPLTYKEVWDKVVALREYLRQQGIQKGDKVAIMSNNRPEWVVSDMAIMSLGAVVVPIYPTLSQEDMAYILKDSDSKIAIVELKQHVDFAEEDIQEGNALSLISILDPSNHTTFSQVLETVSEDTGFNSTSIRSDDVASIVYTSGTTGNPKGVMLTHGNFISNVEDIQAALPLTHTDRVLSFLPLSHVFERTAGYYTVLAIGGQIYYAESITSVAEDMLLAKPTVLVSVPRLYEKIQAKIVAGLTGAKKPLFNAASSFGLKYGKFSDKKSSVFHKLILKLWDTLVFSKIRQKTGGHLRFFVSGGAPLGKELGNFFRAVGLLIIEGYGQTETSPVVACNRPGAFKMGSIGLPLERVEVKIAEDGELLVKGPNVMKGYYKKPEKTAETMSKDGWLHTGDIAHIDEDGFIFIVDRKKDLIVLSNGKNIPPQVIEKKLAMSQFISQVVVTGEGRNYITALIVPDYERLVALNPKLAGLDNAALASNADVMAVIQSEIDQQSAEFSRYEKIKKFILLEEELTQEGGELTPTLKPKRKVVKEKFGHLIEAMY
jgi:long-chain acyl-CoA synthetase